MINNIPHEQALTLDHTLPRPMGSYNKDEMESKSFYLNSMIY